jgi:hypothetical protein
VKTSHPFPSAMPQIWGQHSSSNRP